MRTIITLIIFTATCLLATAQEASVQRVRERFAAARPVDKDLEIYRLDWVVPLEAAREKAVKEKRPLLVVAVRNAHGDTFTGYC